MARDRAVSVEEDVKFILGFGNPLLDLMTSSVEQELLDKWGATLNSAMLAEEKHQPLFKELAETHAIDYVAGGATLNSIRVAQWVLTGGDKGKCTSYVGCVGEDAFGAKMAEQLGKDGVEAHLMRTDAKPTGTCAVLVKDTERALVANLAAAECYSMDHFKTPEVLEAVRQAEIYYMAAFPLTHAGGGEAVIEICKHAALKNKVVCMNISAPFICQVPPLREALLKALKYTSYVFCNESEAAELAKGMEWGDISMVEIAKKMAELPSETRWGLKAVITQGADKTIIAHPHTPGKESEVEQYDVQSNPWSLAKEDIKDTNGAGDAFVGGFLSQLACGADEETCVRVGHFAAGAIIQQSGCTCPDIATVDHVL